MNNMNPAAVGFAIGTVPGLAIAYYLFTHVTWYHDMTVTMWTNPWFVVPGLAAGITLAVLTDK